MYFSWNTTVLSIINQTDREAQIYVPILDTVLYFFIPQACSAVLYAGVFVDDQDGL